MTRRLLETAVLGTAVLAATLLGGCQGTPHPQAVRVEVDPSDAVCSMRQGEQPIALDQTTRSATVQVTPAPLVVECRRAGYETVVVRKYSLQYQSTTGAPLLLLLDPGTFKSDAYPPVIRVVMERS